MLDLLNLEALDLFNRLYGTLYRFYDLIYFIVLMFEIIYLFGVLTTPDYFFILGRYPRSYFLDLVKPFILKSKSYTPKLYGLIGCLIISKNYLINIKI